MRCRSLVENPFSNEKQGVKWDIVWFGSHGRNNNYIPQYFNESDFIDGEPAIKDNGVWKKWKSIYKNYYIMTEGPWLNMSEEFGETPIWPSEEPALLPSDDLYPNTGHAIYYFKYDEKTETFIPIETIPADWKDNYNKYWIAKFVLNDSPTYDPSKRYYAHGNRLPADNYASNAKGVRDSLVQRLSVLKGELWYKASYGIPLTEKIKNKGIYDSIIVNIITSHPDVANLVEFSSSIDKATRKYDMHFVVQTMSGEEVEMRYGI